MPLPNDNPFYKKHFIDIRDFDTQAMQLFFEKVAHYQQNTNVFPCRHKILASCFFEPSTRTRLSFESAMLRAGGQVIGFSEPKNTSLAKGESLRDTISVLSGYADVIVLRHPKEGAARLAGEVSSVPIINAGDGSNQHPTQTLLDLYSIHATQGRLDGLEILFMGDLRFSRTVHSLILSLLQYDVRYYFVSPEYLSLPKYLLDYLKSKRQRFSFHKKVTDVVANVDILYVTRIQKERFVSESHLALSDPQFQYQLTLRDLEKAKTNCRVLHPLPRIDEIDEAVDDSPFAYYFQQAHHGQMLRQTLLSLLLNESFS